MVGCFSSSNSENNMLHILTSNHQGTLQLSELLENQSLNVLTITELSDECLVVSYEHKEPAPLPNPNTNVVIAAFTTAIARLKLYGYLKTIGRRVLYYDTGGCDPFLMT